MLFIAPFVYSGEEVSIDRVEVDVLGEVQLVASKAESDEIVQQRLRGDFGEIITAEFCGEAFVSFAG